MQQKFVYIFTCWDTNRETSPELLNHHCSAILATTSTIGGYALIVSSTYKRVHVVPLSGAISTSNRIMR